MLWKRKDTDVFPEFIHVDQKVSLSSQLLPPFTDPLQKSKWSNYHRIKDNVVVIPTKDYLYLRGFLPKPEHMKHNLVQIEEQQPQHDHPLEEKKEADEPVQETTTPVPGAEINPSLTPTTPQNQTKPNSAEQKV